MSSAFVKSGLVVGGGVLGILAFVAYEKLANTASCGANPNQPGCSLPLHATMGSSSANDSPATAHGGSFSVHGKLDWTVAANNTSASTSLTYNPTVLYFDGVDKVKGSTTNPDSAKVTSSTNWKVVLTYRKRNAQSEDPDTKLYICSQLSCVVDGNAVGGQSIYLVPSVDKDGNPVGKFTPQWIDRQKGANKYGSIFYDLNECDGLPAGLHSYCDHPFKVSVSTWDATQTPPAVKPQDYHCVDGECTIGIDYQ